MELGINLGYWGAGMDADNLAVAREADKLGYAVCWAAEAYGSDAPTVLSYVAAQTERIDIGSAIMQIPARQPAMTAMTAATLDSLSGGRFRLGLGVSGPQVSEGWYGVKFDKPLARTREYVDIVRRAMSRERLSYEGEHWTLPLPGGPGKPLKMTVHPQREHIPLYIAAIGPKNLEQTGEIADGALLIFPAAEHLEETALTHLRAGREKAGETLEGFDVVPTLPSRSAPTRTCPRSPTCSARTPPCTSAAWAAGSRTSTTSSPSAWATRRKPPRSRTSTWAATRRVRGPRCRIS